MRTRAFDKFKKDFSLPDSVRNIIMPSSGDDEPSSCSGSLPADASIGYDPTGGDEYYVGAGKYIRGDTGGVMTGTGRDELVGGFAGGEKGLLQYRDVLATDSRLTPTRFTLNSNPET